MPNLNPSSLSTKMCAAIVLTAFAGCDDHEIPMDDLELIRWEMVNPRHQQLYFTYGLSLDLQVSEDLEPKLPKFGSPTSPPQSVVSGLTITFEGVGVDVPSERLRSLCNLSLPTLNVSPRIDSKKSEIAIRIGGGDGAHAYFIDLFLELDTSSATNHLIIEKMKVIDQR